MIVAAGELQSTCALLCFIVLCCSADGLTPQGTYTLVVIGGFVRSSSSSSSPTTPVAEAAAVMATSGGGTTGDDTQATATLSTTTSAQSGVHCDSNVLRLSYDPSSASMTVDSVAALDVPGGVAGHTAAQLTSSTLLLVGGVGGGSGTCTPACRPWRRPLSLPLLDDDCR